MANIRLMLSFGRKTNSQGSSFADSQLLNHWKQQWSETCQCLLVQFEHGRSNMLPFRRAWSVPWVKLKLVGTETRLCKPEKAHCDDFLGLRTSVQHGHCGSADRGRLGWRKQARRRLFAGSFLGLTMPLYMWIQSDTKLAVLHSKRGLKAHFYCQLFMFCFTVWAT